MSNPNPAPEHRWKKGEQGCVSPSKSRANVRNNLSTNFLRAFNADFEEHGADAIKKVRETDPATYVRVAASILPKEIELKHPVEELSDDDLANLLALAQRLVAGELASAVAERAGAETVN